MAGFIRFFRSLRYGRRNASLASFQRLTSRAGADGMVSATEGALEIPREPEGAELMENISQGRWIEESLRPWAAASGVHETRVGSIVPEGFESYARVFHPAALRDSGQQPVRWSPVSWATAASWTGRVVHPQMQFERIANLSKPYEDPAWGSFPRYGCLPPEECRSIANVLREFTSTPNRCYYCVWEGWGFLDPGRYKTAPRLTVPGRGYLPFSGPLDAVMSFLDHIPIGGRSRRAFGGLMTAHGVWQRR